MAVRSMRASVEASMVHGNERQRTKGSLESPRLPGGLPFLPYPRVMDMGDARSQCFPLATRHALNRRRTKRRQGWWCAKCRGCKWQPSSSWSVVDLPPQHSTHTITNPPPPPPTPPHPTPPRPTPRKKESNHGHGRGGRAVLHHRTRRGLAGAGAWVAERRTDGGAERQGNIAQAGKDEWVGGWVEVKRSEGRVFWGMDGWVGGRVYSLSH